MKQESTPVKQPTWHGHERWHTPRWNLGTPLRVFDAVTDEFVGNVVNVSLDGMLVLANQFFDPHRTLQCTVELPDDDGKWSKVLVHVLGKHTTQSGVDNLYRVGCHFVDITPKLLSQFQHLIDNSPRH